MTIATRFREVFGADVVPAGDATLAFALDGMHPQCVVLPHTVDEVSRAMAMAQDARLTVVIVGNGAHLAIGNPPHRYDVAICTRRLRRILAHEAADMTVTVEAGATVGEVNAALAQAGQCVPLDPPHPEDTTIGALVAMDASGPWRLSQGRARDLLIGISVVLADGTLVKGGGRVVKNVAGYDLMKLFTGSFGTLGTVVEATFKVRPAPEHHALFRVAFPDLTTAFRFALQVLAVPLAPYYVEVLGSSAAAAVGCGNGPVVVVGACGGIDEIAAQEERLRDLATEANVHSGDAAEAERCYRAIRDLPADGFDRDHTLGCKLSLLPSRLQDVLSHVEAEAPRSTLQCTLLSHVGSGVAYLRWHGAGDDMLLRFAESVRAATRAADGWAMFDVVPSRLKGRLDSWDPDIPGLALMRRIKLALDPQRRLSPGRFVGRI